MPTVTEVANAFRLALDENEFRTARTLLHDDCVYHVRDELITGAESIIASYRSADAEAEEVFDSFSYDISLHAVDEAKRAATIEFIDHLELKGHAHTHRCHQRIELAETGLIIRIDHIDLPGEREALNAFLGD